MKCSQFSSHSNQLSARSTGTTCKKDPDVSRRTDETGRRTACRFCAGYARLETIQALVPGGDARNEGGVLDLPTSYEHSTASTTSIVEVLGHTIRVSSGRCRTCKDPRDHLHPPPLSPFHQTSRSCGPIHWRRRMGRYNLHRLAPRPPKRSDCLHSQCVRSKRTTKGVEGLRLRESHGRHSTYLQREILRWRA